MASKQVDPILLEKQIREYNRLYRNGEPTVTDEVFDNLVDLLRKLNPNANWFKKGVQDEIKDRKEKLPIPMYSLEKIKTFEEFKKWVISCQLTGEDILIITSKYDGISLCVNEVVGDAWTRGDGIEGQNCRDHYKVIRGSAWFPNDYDQITFSFGEAIFRIGTFLKIKEEANYKSARNAVAGLINSSDVSPYVRNVSYIRYGCDREDWDKKSQLDFLNFSSASQVPYVALSVDNLCQNEQTFVQLTNKLFDQLSKDFKCDGLVIDVNKADKRQSLGRLPNNNPKYAIAYKNPDWSEREETIVKSIDWQISKDGRLAPVVNVESIELCGATVSRCSAYNARYVSENDIDKDARIIIARSGDVIPKHLKTTKIPSLRTLPGSCPVCGKSVKWNENLVDLICTNESCDGILLARCVYFFSVLDFKEFREPTIKKIFDAGYKYPYQIIDMNEEELQSIEGLGNVASKVLSRQFEELRKRGTNFAKLLTAANYFEGVMAEKTCQKILNGLMLFTKQEINIFAQTLDKGGVGRNILYGNIANIEGIGETTAIAFMKGIDRWWKELIGRYDFIPITFYGLEEKTFEGQMTIVFTGFRNSEWEKQLTEKGHKIGSSVSKKTSCLVVKEKGSGSTKETKAESLGIPIFTSLEFKEKFL